VVGAVRAREEFWDAVRGVLDPEVPVLSVVDLGIVRDVREEGDTVVVDVTPTYSGCPAMRVIEDDITAALKEAGAASVRVNTVFHPVWTTDWISGTRENDCAPTASPRRRERHQSRRN